MDSDKCFAKNLKAIRTAANISVNELSKYLTELGYKATIKTIYSWESGNSQPTPGALLEICKYCGIQDVLGAFGYGPIDITSQFSFSEIQLILAYRRATVSAQKVVDLTLEPFMEDSGEKSETAIV